MTDLENFQAEIAGCSVTAGGDHIPTINEHLDAWCYLCAERLLLPGTAGGPALESDR